MTRYRYYLVCATLGVILAGIYAMAGYLALNP